MKLILSILSHTVFVYYISSRGLETDSCNVLLTIRWSKGVHKLLTAIYPSSLKWRLSIPFVLHMLLRSFEICDATTCYQDLTTTMEHGTNILALVDRQTSTPQGDNLSRRTAHSKHKRVKRLLYGKLSLNLSIVITGGHFQAFQSSNIGKASAQAREYVELLSDAM